MSDEEDVTIAGAPARCPECGQDAPTRAVQPSGLLVFGAHPVAPGKESAGAVLGDPPGAYTHQWCAGTFAPVAAS